MNKIRLASAIALLVGGGWAASYIYTAYSADAEDTLSLSVARQPVLEQIQPFYSGSTLYIPAVILLEYYPYTISWNNTDKQLILTDSSSSVTLTPGSSDMHILYAGSDAPFTDSLSGNVLLEKGHLYLPAGDIASLTGAEVEVNEAENVVEITPGSVSTAVRTPEEPLATAGMGGEVKLYTALQDGGMYRGFIMEAAGVRHAYDWEAPRDVRYPPQLYAEDVDGDGIPEAVVMLTLGTGTGLFAQEVHVVKPEDWTELEVADAGTAAREAVSSSIAIAGSDISITLQVKGASPENYRVLLPDRAEDGLDYFGTEAGFGAVTYYRVEAGHLMAETSVMIGTQESIGSVEIEYKPSGSGLVPGAVRFVPDDTSVEADGND